MKKYLLTSLILGVLSSSLFGNEEYINSVKTNDTAKAISIINNGLNVNEKMKVNTTAIMWAAKYGNLELVKFLISKKADLNQIDDSKNDVYSYSLMYGTEKKNYEISKLLINSGYNVNNILLKGKTPLILTVEIENTELINLLISKGADKSIKDTAGQTAKDVAIELEHEELAKML